MSWGGVAAVGIGAALGAWLRWCLGVALNATWPALPFGTLLANLTGGYGIGIAVAYFGQAPHLPDAWRLFVITGFLGGLTTFSTFSSESLALLQRGEIGWAAAHSALHLFGCLAAAWLGLLTFRTL